MDQEKAVNKAMFWLKELDLITVEQRDLIRNYLNWLYVMGWEERGWTLTAHNKKRVVQYNRKGKVLAEFESIEEASSKTGLNTAGLYSAVLRGTVTKKGHIWKYAENGASKNGSRGNI